MSRNCLGRELCRYCYQLLLHCFVKYSAGILFAVKVWRLCKWIELYFFACRQRIEFCTREKCFLFGYDIHDCTMYSCMSDQVTMLLKHLLCWPSFSLLISTWQFMKHCTFFQVTFLSALLSSFEPICCDSLKVVHHLVEVCLENYLLVQRQQANQRKVGVNRNLALN